MKTFFGNLQDPSLEYYQENGLHIFPGAFWLEPFWRDTRNFTVEWLIENARRRDIVLLFHPDNIMIDAMLKRQLIEIIENVPTKVID